MYKGIGDTQAGSFRDGVFSHATPYQSYEAGQRQAGDGSLGAIQLFTRQRKMRQRRPLPPLPHWLRSGRFISGLGHPHTMMPAFQEMSGLGDTTAPNLSLPSNLTPATVSDLATVNAEVESLKQTVMVGGAVLGAAVAYLLLKK